jgi:hypothetical protein
MNTDMVSHYSLLSSHLLSSYRQEAYIRKMTNEALARASQLDKANMNDDVS